MKLVTTIMAATGIVVACGAIVPAKADRDDWRRNDWRRHEQNQAWRQNEWRDNHRWGYAPPVVVAPPQAYTYYTPAPPVYYGYGYNNPGMTFGFTVR